MCLLERRFSVSYGSFKSGFLKLLSTAHVLFPRNKHNACDDDGNAHAASCAPSRFGTDPFRAFVMLGPPSHSVLLAAYGEGKACAPASTYHPHLPTPPCIWLFPCTPLHLAFPD